MRNRPEWEYSKLQENVKVGPCTRKATEKRFTTVRQKVVGTLGLLAVDQHLLELKLQRPEPEPNRHPRQVGDAPMEAVGPRTRSPWGALRAPLTAPRGAVVYSRQIIRRAARTVRWASTAAQTTARPAKFALEIQLRPAPARRQLTSARYSPG